MKCPSCGAEAKGKYCEYCGSEMPKENVVINITNNYYGVTERQQNNKVQDTTQSKAQKTTKNKGKISKRTWWILGWIFIFPVPLTILLLRNKKMRSFLSELAAICGSEISEISPENYIEQLRWLGKKTLGDMEQLMEENHDLALSLAKTALENTDLDILSSSVGLRFLCRAELLNKKYSEEQATEFLMLSVGDKSRASRMAKSLLKSKNETNNLNIKEN